MREYGETTSYEVEWHVPAMRKQDEYTLTSRVQVTEGYTTVDDIPRIIAVARTGDPKLADLVIVDKITPI